MTLVYLVNYSTAMLLLLLLWPQVGARCHGGEGTWLPVVKECIGYSQVELTVSLYTDAQLFESVDNNVYPLMKVDCLSPHCRLSVCLISRSNRDQVGMDVDLVSRYGGIIRGFPGESLVTALPSFRSISWESKIGEYSPVTIDCFTRY